jgi:hypothetical protein
MAVFTLKRYVRPNPDKPTIGILEKEWSFQAKSVADAVFVAQTEFMGNYEDGTDFYIMSDVEGKHVWGSVIDA